MSNGFKLLLYTQVIPQQAASLYDAVILYAMGLNASIAKGQSLKGQNIMVNIKALGKFKSKLNKVNE